VRAIKDIRPKTVGQLRKMLGLLTFYSTLKTFQKRLVVCMNFKEQTQMKFLKTAGKQKRG